MCCIMLVTVLIDNYFIPILNSLHIILVKEVMSKHVHHN